MEIKGIGYNFSKPVRKTTKQRTVDSAKNINAIKNDYNDSFNEYNNVVPIKGKLDLEITNKIYFNETEEWSINREIISNHTYIITGTKLTTILFKLSTTALKLVGYISTHLTHNSNRIDIDTDSLAKQLNVSSRSMYSAFAELDANDIMYRTVKHGIYSINPLYLFKGSMVRFLKLYNKKYGDEQVQLDDKGRIIIDD